MDGAVNGKCRGRGGEGRGGEGREGRGGRGVEWSGVQWRWRWSGGCGGGAVEGELS